jgi:hypothetical protein
MMSFDDDIKSVWTATYACIGCVYLDEKCAWCNDVDLPCTVNPILSFQYGITGTACCGAGIFKKEPTLFDDDDDELPF